ncbi:hypothetical protein BCV69DRAFT_220277 [Microstroma glucosiphilum]|uniref:Uncharacterized protein n=1 Tax=Pseudomicrostroma glucosiphilum TaxID=1684307 RepID=A0A316U4B9_9BASI|nr:hypothetical protein BCV69DRAFT_220277 [Pseudomicrostroma glucosiphilum]PWN20116.1 hypothetical protein BCV69DRAFT_220277 [Pseudomicrostroma glucosiphilum]
MLRVHDSVAPGPHRPAPARPRGPWAALPGQDGDFFGGLFNFADGRGLDLHNLTNLLRVHHHAPARGGAAARGGHRPRQSPHLALQIPTKHDFKMVLNHRERPVKVGFSFGIIEPPLDVETFEEDPRIIRGALPDTSPICAGCDCALVLGGDGKKRMWALPCGHVVDGRCYERYRAGVNAKTARELAHGEVEREKREQREQQHTRITDLLAGVKRSHPDEADSSSTEDEDGLPHPSVRLATGPEALDPKGKDRAISPSLPSSAVIVGEGSASSTSRALRHRAMQQSEALGSGNPQLSPKASTKSSHSTKGQASETAESERVVAFFTCPVDGCSQRISTSPNKPSSAIELYI